MHLNDIYLDQDLTPEQVEAPAGALNILEQSLPWLVSLNPDTRKRLRLLGPKSERFVQEAHSVARNHADMLPGALDVTALDRDVKVRQALLPIQQRLEALLTKVKDTQLLAGSDLFQAAALVYRSLQSHGHTAGLQAVTASLGRRFEAQGRRTEEPSTTPADGTPGGVPAAVPRQNAAVSSGKALPFEAARASGPAQLHSASPAVRPERSAATPPCDQNRSSPPPAEIRARIGEACCQVLPPSAARPLQDNRVPS